MKKKLLVFSLLLFNLIFLSACTNEDTTSYSGGWKTVAYDGVSFGCPPKFDLHKHLYDDGTGSTLCYPATILLRTWFHIELIESAVEPYEPVKEEYVELDGKEYLMVTRIQGNTNFQYINIGSSACIKFEQNRNPTQEEIELKNLVLSTVRIEDWSSR